MPSRASRTGAPERLLRPGEELTWYLVAGVTYVAAGTMHKALLTWLVGPAWVVAVLWLGPAALDRVAQLAGGVRRRWPR